ASCFNEMADGIQKSHANLENAVRQRTKELRAIAGLSSEAFRGDRALKEIAEQFLDAIIGPLGYEYAALYLIDKETGLLLQEFKKGVDNDICSVEISLASEHPFIKTIREAKPTIKNSQEINAPDSFGNVVIIPILSHQRKRCREVNNCAYETCPAFNSADERCWLINGTLCRSPQAVAGKEKIYGCLHCNVFPVLGVLIAGKSGDITKTSLHSLEILGSEIASAIENQRLIEGKKEDIVSLIRLHDMSVETIRNLNPTALAQSIASSATVFAGMDAAILWLTGKDGILRMEALSNIEKELVPVSIQAEETFIGRSLSEERSMETIRVQDVDGLGDLIQRHGFLYMAAIPVKLKGLTFGCLTLFKKKDFFMTDSEKAVVQLFASQAASALNTAQVYNALITERDFSEVILNNVATGIMALDPENRIVKLNPIGFEMLNINDYVIGKKLTDVLPQMSDFLIINSDFSREVEFSDGARAIPIGFNNSPITYTDKKQTGTVVVFRDLTEIKKLQAEVRKKQHFAAMEKIMAGVAHEIRNPLFGISSIVQILEREVKSVQHRELMQTMLKEIHRIKNLIDELLLYSRPSRLDIKEVNLNALMDKVKYYVTAKKETAAVNLAIDPSVVIMADMDKLTQVFMNLVDNALNAGSKNIDITVEKNKDRTLITAKDNGLGIKQDIIDRICDPFFTTRKEGTGLGLSICKKIIEDHGGNMEIRSIEGTGTTVLLELPS
ncbi:MAG: GAF domain-containing protein, partial [Nitrospirae bacterium]